ncbi:MAG: ABC transporter permease [Ruminococcaceae bacterium]|nr:ABC transporter permease [Oscillospiraceae bacterium]
MNVFHKVTLQSLKKNPTRTVVTVIGIVLSAAMICAVTTFASSMRRFAYDNAVYSDGDWHASALGITAEEWDTLSENEQLESAVWSENIGYAVLDGGINEYKPYVCLTGVSEGFFDRMPVHLTAGRLPQTAGEVLLPSHVASNGGVRYAVGDTLMLSLGERQYDGVTLTQQNPFIAEEDGAAGETFVPNGANCTVTVVGFYERPSFEEYTAPGYTVLTVAEGKTAAVRDVYYKIRKPKTVYTFVETVGLAGEVNSDVLMYTGISRYSAFSTVLYSLAVIVIVLIMFGSVSLIYNAFSISVAERTRQFGLLSSIGATKKQLRGTVLFEAAAVAAVGIPLGIGCGIGGMAVTLALIGNKFRSLGFAVPMHMHVSLVSIVAAAVVAMLTVLISAWIPAKRATKVSAVEAIRQNQDIVEKRRGRSTPKIVVKLFGLPGALASKYFRRSRKKYRATVVSLFMSVVLFISASAFCSYLTASVEGGFETFGFDIRYQPDADSPLPIDVLTDTLRDMSLVNEAVYVNGMLMQSTVDETVLTDRYKANNLYTSKVSNEVNVYTYFVEDAEYRTFLEQNGLSPATYMDPDSPLGVAIDDNVMFDRSEERYVTMRVLKDTHGEFVAEFIKEPEGYHTWEMYYDEDGRRIVRYIRPGEPPEYLEMPYEEAAVAVTAPFGTVLYERPYFVDTTPDLLLLYPYSAIDALLVQGVAADVPQVMMKADDHAAACTAIRNYLAEQGLSEAGLEDYAVQAENNRNTILIIRVFSYGFIVLISLIAAANVFNTISTNIALRRRELAMLRSVGMTQKGFRQMMNYECLLYGGKALLWGLPAAFGVTYLIHLAINQGYETAFQLPWGAVAIAVCSVFLVVFVTMVYAMQKIRRENPIDALRNENM